MRVLIAVAALLLGASGSQTASAVEYPWCVHYSMDGDVTNCGFVSWEQCRWTAAGTAGFCQRNPFYAAAHGIPKRRHATRRQPKG